MTWTAGSGAWLRRTNAGLPWARCSQRCARQQPTAAVALCAHCFFEFDIPRGCHSPPPTPPVLQILVDQFTRLRDGDAFWWQRTDVAVLPASVRNDVAGTSLVRKPCLPFIRGCVSIAALSRDGNCRLVVLARVVATAPCMPMAILCVCMCVYLPPGGSVEAQHRAAKSAVERLLLQVPSGDRHRVQRCEQGWSAARHRARCCGCRCAA